ncbi:MAG: NAD(P)/FAD-dependent oxidoreductase, partial [Candidatus Bipolaricaulia bacterium]
MRVVILGNGIAGVTAARTLREQDSETEIEIYADEEHHFYPRPQLIELLAERVLPERVVLHDERWYRDRGIAVHLQTEVASLELEREQIVLQDGKRVGYDRLLLATGALPYLPEIPGIEHEGVFTLRTIRDALALKERALKAEELIVIGGGILGLEAARALRTTTGVRAYVLERCGWPLSRQLDRQGGELLMRQLQGVEIVTEAQSLRILGDGRVRGVELRDGRIIDGGLVLIATGVRPNVALAREAGLEVNRGIVVDEHLQT